MKLYKPLTFSAASYISAKQDVNWLQALFNGAPDKPTEEG